MAQSSSGISGNKSSAGFGGEDLWLVKLDSNGDKQWEKVFGGTSDESTTSVRQTSDGGYIFACSSASGVNGNKTSATFGSSDVWVIRTDAGGTKQWEQAFGGSGVDSFGRLKQTSDGGFIIANGSQSQISGNKTKAGFGSEDIWLIKTDRDGNKQWEQVFGSTGLDEIVGVRQVGDRGYLLNLISYSGVSGNKTTPSFGGSDVWLVKVDADGVKQWEQAFGGNNDDGYGPSLELTSDAGLILGMPSASGVSGNKTTAGFGGNDGWIVKLALQEAPVGTPNISLTGQFKGADNFTFGGSAQVTISSSFANGTIFYSLDGSTPNFFSTRYAGPFNVTQTATLKAVAYSSDFSAAPESDPVTITIRPVRTLSASVPGGGSVAFDPPGGQYIDDTVVTLTATPAPGFSFLNWTGDASGSTATTTVRLTGNKSVQAAFGTTITTTIAGQGTISFNPPQGPYAYGSTVRLTAVPAANYFFALWGNAAVSAGSANPLDFTVNAANPTISSLFFTPIPSGQFTLVALASGNGSVSASPQKNLYVNGETVTLTATPGPGLVLGNWSGDASGNQNPLTVVMTANKTITANFRAAVVPTITDFNPKSGPVGTTVTITGTNFDPTPGNNRVFFGAARATVTAATVTQLTVTVPVGSTYSFVRELGRMGPARSPPHRFHRY